MYKTIPNETDRDWIEITVDGFLLQVTIKDIQMIIYRVINDGVGDWAVIDHVTHTENREYTVPIQISCIDTNKAYDIEMQDILYGIQRAWIDFPYALDITAGYRLNINKLTPEDVDEIIQLAVFKRIQYGYVW